MPEVTTPITVNPDPMVSQLATAGRYLLTIIGGYAIARGWLDAGAVEFVTAIALTIVPLAYGVWRTYRERRLLVVAANAAPDQVARVAR